MLFPETHWTLLADATLHGGAKEREALEQFCLRYLPPVKACFRGRGVATDKLDDVTQDFFLHLMENSLPRRADRARGKFRTFISASIVNYLHTRRDKEQAQKRGGSWQPVSLDILDGTSGGAGTTVAPVHVETMDRQWAMHLLNRAWTELEERWSAPGDRNRFLVLRRFLPGADSPPPTDEACAALACTPAAFRQQLSRLRAEFSRVLRREVAETVSSQDELDEELAYLGRLLKTDGPPVNAEARIPDT